MKSWRPWGSRQSWPSDRYESKRLAKVSYYDKLRDSPKGVCLSGQKGRAVNPLASCLRRFESYRAHPQGGRKPPEIRIFIGDSVAVVGPKFPPITPLLCYFPLVFARDEPIAFYSSCCVARHGHLIKKARVCESDAAPESTHRIIAVEFPAQFLKSGCECLAG